MSEDTRLKGICYEMYLCVLYGECKTITDLQAKYEDLIVNYDENNPPSHEDDTEKYFYPSVKLRLKSMCYELFLAIQSGNQDIIQDLKDEFDYLVRKYYSYVPSGGASGGITNHEELENLMGGNSSGHYHLTEAELQTVREGGGSNVEIANNLTTTTTGKALDAYQGKILNDKIDNLDIPTDIVYLSEVRNDLTTYESGYVLDARQGEILKDLIDNLDSRIDDLDDRIDGLSQSSSSSPSGLNLSAYISWNDLYSYLEDWHIANTNDPYLSSIYFTYVSADYGYVYNPSTENYSTKSNTLYPRK